MRPLSSCSAASARVSALIGLSAEPPIHAGMQVARGRLQRSPGNRRRPRRPVVSAGVSMSHMPVSLITATSARSSLAVGGEERVEVEAADLLLALDQHGDRHRQAAGRLHPGAQRAEPHRRPAPCRRRRRAPPRACRAGHRPASARTAGWSTGRADRRLHVVMAVEQQMRHGGGGPGRDGARARTGCPAVSRSVAVKPISARVAARTRRRRGSRRRGPAAR